MRKFRFPLEKVLTVRELRKLIAEEKLGVLLKDMYRVEKALENARAVVVDNQTHLREQLSGYLDLDTVQDLLNFRTAAGMEVTKTEAELSRKDSQVKQAQEEVVARNQEMKALQRLKQKQVSHYKVLYWWEHSKQMDRMGALYFNREEGRR
ncbi:MAG TPA: hypothetical protein GX529_04375 [Firmicutes bacterium]|nr:hypothetical protein [Candidatus Fermentithermobacillaceae bacterium]